MIDGLKEPVHVYFKDSGDAKTSKEIKVFLDKNFAQKLNYFFPESINEFKEFILHQKTQGGTVIICGGDGLLNNSLALLADSNMDLLPIPAGTANDLSREMGWFPVPRKVRLLSRKKIDLLSVNGRFFSTIGGIGIGSDVIVSLNKIRAKNLRWMSSYKGKWIYTFLALTKILNRRKKVYRYAVQDHRGKTIKGSAVSIFICNQKTIAGTFKVSNDSVNNDGRFELVIVGSRHWLQRISRGFISLFQRSRTSTKGSVLHFSNSVTLQAEGKNRPVFFADGEILSVGNPDNLEFNIHPGALSIIQSK